MGRKVSHISRTEHSWDGDDARALDRPQHQEDDAGGAFVAGVIVGGAVVGAVALVAREEASTRHKAAMRNLEARLANAERESL